METEIELWKHDKIGYLNLEFASIQKEKGVAWKIIILKLLDGIYKNYY